MAGWYWCDRLQVDPFDQPYDVLDQALDDLARLAAAAGSVAELGHRFDRYPEVPAAGRSRRALMRGYVTGTGGPPWVHGVSTGSGKAAPGR